jgi:hypothetical protein
MKKFYVLFLVTSLICLGSHKSSAFQNASPREHFTRPIEPEAGIFMLYESGEGIACREATPEEALPFSARDHLEPLHTITRFESQSSNAKDNGLRIVLRATAQLERFPAAKEAFLRVARLWEDRIQSPITVILDVDFGTTLFGTPWPTNSIGGSDAQELTNSGIYQQVRAQLISKASSEQQLAIYNTLPASALPTDIGTTTTMRGTSANARALGLLDPVADPEGKEKDLGKPPSVGFNSSFKFDYDPTDGIDSDKYDFEAIALHEIGHVLGFISKVGARELDSKLPIAPSVWDLFRLRPGTDSHDFSTSQRVLSSGGEQVFTAAGLELPLATGRPNGTGGDSFQGSHWKNDDLIDHWYIGVMEVGIPAGKRQVMTSNDLLALQLMGYELRSGSQIVPEPALLRGKIQGDALILTGMAANISGGMMQARIKLLDDAGLAITEYPPVSFNPDSFPISSYTFHLSGLGQWAAAAEASLTFIDDLGNHSATITGSILSGDDGGPVLKRVSFSEGEVSIKGKRLIGQLSIEVNGVVVSTVTGGSNKKLKIAAAGLNLAKGANRLRIIKDGLVSNILMLNL